MNQLHFYCLVNGQVGREGRVEIGRPHQLAGHRVQTLHVVGEAELGEAFMRQFLDWLMMAGQQLHLAAIRRAEQPIMTVAPMRFPQVYVNAQLNCFDDCKELFERLSELYEPQRGRQSGYLNPPSYLRKRFGPGPIEESFRNTQTPPRHVDPHPQD